MSTWSQPPASLSFVYGQFSTRFLAAFDLIKIIEEVQFERTKSTYQNSTKKANMATTIPSNH